MMPTRLLLPCLIALSSIAVTALSLTVQGKESVTAKGKEVRAENVAAQTLSNEEKQLRFNYQMFCQGCHSPDGTGFKSVPTLKGFIHNFMATEQGREYLVRVPGSANAPLSDEDLAKLLNWMLVEFSNETEQTWQPFTEKEVGEYRQSPLFETIEYRKLVLKNLPKK